MRSSIQPDEHYLTLDEYLRIEDDSTVKHEYLDGIAYAMAGGDDRYSLIAANLIHLVRLHSRQGCRPYTSDLKVYIEAINHGYYPDASIVRGEPIFHDRRRLLLINPIVIVEVLSPTTEKRDRGSKAENYQLIPSLRELLLITSDKPRIEYLRMFDGEWTKGEVRGANSEMIIPSIDCRFKLSELYAH
ncbi:MAG: Uma2 family endonuclease [Blastocatellia bacterium]|nr:Uma2 family endonuclease [Blastocatellia bacterium]